MSNWSDYYRSRVNNQKYTSYFHKRYARFFDEVNSRLTGTALESGSGTGLVTKLLDNQANVSCFDRDPDMLSLSEHNTDQRVERKQFDIRNPLNRKFDMIFSHGVLEHFEDNEIRHIIDNQKQSTSTIVHYVPSYKYGKGSFGDERLLTKKEWHKICAPDKIIDFNDQHDYILVWEKS